MFFSYIVSALAGILALPLVASAHIAYVTSEADIIRTRGGDAHFLLNTLGDPFHIALMATTVILGSILFIYVMSNHSLLAKGKKIEQHLLSYQDLIPWMIRLSLGIALIGAGTTHVLVSPAVPLEAFSFIQILVGFLLMTGFLLGPATVATLFLFLTALALDGYMVGNLDFLALTLSLWILGSSRPGIDDIFNIYFPAPFKKASQYVPLIMRLGVGITMMYLALAEKILNPHTAEFVATHYHLTSVIPVSAGMWVLSTGLIELAVGFLILIGCYTRIVSAITFLILSATFFYFQEAVYFHVTLFGALSILFVTGGGLYSADATSKSRK